MKSLRYALAFIGAAGALAVIGAIAVVVSSDQDYSRVNAILLTALPSLAFIGTGLFAWYRRPDNRCGPLMTATGFAWLAVPMGLANSPWLYALGQGFSNTVWILLSALLLSFPTGRLEARWHRWLLAVLVFDAVILSLTGVLLAGPHVNADMCPTCPQNPAAIWDSQPAFDIVNGVSSIGGILLIFFVLFIVGRRFRHLEAANRVAIRPLLAAGSVTISLLACTLLATNLGTSDKVQQSFFLATGLALACIPFAFLAGLLRSRISSAEAVGRLVSTLGESGEIDLDIEKALADALGDPRLELVYWLPEREQYVGASGAPQELPAATDQLKLVPIEHDGELIAGVIHDPAVNDDERLVAAAGSAAALALRNQRLAVELRATVEELRASRARIVESSDNARRALERNLHDGAQQHLVSMAVTLRLASEKLDSNPETARQMLERASADLDAATTELRELARGIHPAILTDRGLGPALSALADRSAVPVALEIAEGDRLPPAIESAAYFVAAEALTNTARYADASTASIRVSQDDRFATIEVADDGAGGAEVGAGSGLRGLEDRVAALGGRLRVASPPGGGTRITAEFPCV